MDLEQIINDNDSGELLDIIKKYFNNDGEFFFQHLIDENLIPSDKVSQELFDVFPNEYIYSLIKQKKYEVVKQFFASNVSDIESKDGRYYLEIVDVSELHKLFHKDIRDFVEEVLKDDYYYDSYHHDKYSIYDLLDDLNDKNKSTLIELIKESSLNRNIRFDGISALIESFIDSDGSDDSSFILTGERLNEIISNNELSTLIEHSPNLNEWYSTLNSSYNQAYNYAMTDEIHEKIYGALKDFFHIPKSENLGTYITKKVYNYKNEVRNVEVLLIDITDLLISYIKESVMLELNNWNDTELIMGYHGSLSDFLYDYFSISRMNLDYVYPDNSSVVEYYNEIFSDNN
jgi:hypothetical protein